MDETRARRTIRKAIEAKGWKVVGEMTWTPISAGAEKSGPEGGWYMEAEAPSGGMDWVLGYNVADCLSCIRDFIKADKVNGLGHTDERDSVAARAREQALALTGQEKSS